MITGTVNFAHLVHLLRFTGDEMRGVLCGVHFAADGKLVASNGHVMGIYEKAHTLGVAVTLDIPKWAATKLGNGSWTDEIAVGQVAEGGDLFILSRHDHVIACRSHATPYPDWSVVLPKGDPVAIDSIRIQPKYLTLFGKWPVFTFYGKEKAVAVRVIDNAQFTGLCMPVRIRD